MSHGAITGTLNFAIKNKICLWKQDLNWKRNHWLWNTWWKTFYWHWKIKHRIKKYQSNFILTCFVFWCVFQWKSNCLFFYVRLQCLFVFYNVRFSCHWFSLSMLFSQMVWRILKNLILKFKLKWKYRVFISKKSRCVSSVFVLICIRDYNGCVCLAIKCLKTIYYLCFYYLNNFKIIWSGGSCIH